jgi:hypothetical protein
VLALPGKDKSEDGMSLRQIGIELQSPVRALMRPVEGSWVEKIRFDGVDPGGLIRVRQERVRAGMISVEGQRLL